MNTVTLSALVVVHNEKDQLDDCLKALDFADVRVVVLDRCIDGSKEIAGGYAERLLEGAWEWEGPRRNIRAYWRPTCAACFRAFSSAT